MKSVALWMVWISAGLPAAAEPQDSAKPKDTARPKDAAEPFRMLVPGFTVRELPIRLTSLNNIEYAADGRLFAGGYDGRFHLLQDGDGDGLEDRVKTFSSETTANYPLGMAVKDGVPYFVLTDEVIRFTDADGDGVSDTRETVAKGFDDPELKRLPYLHNRRVDSSLALALGPDGALYVTMGNAGFSNPYWHDGLKAGGKNPDGPTGTPRYDPDKRRGCLLKITPDGKVERLASGLRYIMSLQFDRHGELFGTDQEGATWCPNGNPFDELLHIKAGRHYGFPPYHPRFLPDVIDEPSVWDYAPQHQSTCGFRFNGPVPGRGRFGPAFWADDALVTGESRGKLWRTSLAKTAAGYVATTQLVASTSLLAVDCAISPKGELLVCCHTGAPDWGNGPNGAGRLFKISANSDSIPQPLGARPRSATETEVEFDRELDPAAWTETARRTWIEGGKYVGAADRFETIRPGYGVVQMQQKQIRRTIAVKDARLAEDRRSLIFETEPRTAAVNYALALPHRVDLAHDLTGVQADWRGNDGTSCEYYLPHPDFAAARHFLRGGAGLVSLEKSLKSPGTLTLRMRVNLMNMLIPETQPRAKLDFVPEPETVTLTFRSDAALSLDVPGAKTERVGETESRATFVGPRPGEWPLVMLTLTTPAERLDVSFATVRDPRPRAMPTRRFLMPFAVPPPADVDSREIPEIAGGNFEAGRRLFEGKAACANCHQLRGKGVRVGADLGNLVHRDYASVLRDIREPNATLNPDAIGYTVVMTDGRTLTGTRLGETADELQLAIPGGMPAVLKKAEIEEIVPLKLSLMPGEIDKLLSAEELRDLMTYLLTEPPR